MSRHVALLRGINVGRAKRIAMSDLKALLGSLGYLDAVTLLNSGNALFTANAGTPEGHAARIREAIQKNLGVAAPVVVLEAASFREIIEANPLRKVATEPSRLMVAFVQKADSLLPLAALAGQKWAPDAFALGEKAAYVWCANGLLESKVAQTVDRMLGENVTMRNWSTVEKIQALLGKA